MNPCASFPKPTFEHWCATVSYYLLLIAGRPLADAPAAEWELGIWWATDVTARDAAEIISADMPRVRATLTRFYTDRRAHEVRKQVLGQLAARGELVTTR